MPSIFHRLVAPKMPPNSTQYQPLLKDRFWPRVDRGGEPFAAKAWTHSRALREVGIENGIAKMQNIYKNDI